MPSEPRRSAPQGWFIGLAVLAILFGVIAGLIGIGVVAKRQQRYRIGDEELVRPTNPPARTAPGTPATSAAPATPAAPAPSPPR